MTALDRLRIAHALAAVRVAHEQEMVLTRRECGLLEAVAGSIAPPLPSELCDDLIAGDDDAAYRRASGVTPRHRVRGHAGGEG